MKSFKTYLKEKTSANNASFASAGSDPATKFSGVMGFGSIAGDSPAANKPGKGDGKDITPEITAAITDGVKRNEIVKDETTGALQFRGLDGTLFNSPHAALESSFQHLVKTLHVRGSKTPMADAEIISAHIKVGILKPIFDKNGKVKGAERSSGKGAERRSGRDDTDTDSPMAFGPFHRPGDVGNPYNPDTPHKPTGLENIPPSLPINIPFIDNDWMDEFGNTDWIDDLWWDGPYRPSFLQPIFGDDVYDPSRNRG